MTKEPSVYGFRFERIERALTDAAGRVLDEGDLDDQWEDLVTDGSQSAVLLSADQASRFANVIASGRYAGTDPRHGAWHSGALTQLVKHDECEHVLHQLIGQRDNVLWSLWYARSYAFNDIYQGEYGDLYISVESFLTQLRPALPDERPYRPLNVTEHRCPECYSTFLHDDDCPIQQEEEAREERRDHAIAAHIHCLDMGQALIAHTAASLARVEEVALKARGLTHQVYGDQVISPHKVLPILRLEDLNIDLNPQSPATLATYTYPPLVDPPYCGAEDDEHYEPHRACRFLVS